MSEKCKYLVLFHLLKSNKHDISVAEGDASLCAPTGLSAKGQEAKPELNSED